MHFKSDRNTLPLVPLEGRSRLEPPAAAPRWSIFTNHGHVLLFLAANPDARIRDIADATGITQRTTQVMLNDLKDAGYITTTSTGRRNHYRLARDMPLHHPAEAGLTVNTVLEVATRSSAQPDSDQPRLVF